MSIRLVVETLKKCSMQKSFIGILIIILLAIFFAIQNSQDVIISFWFWNMEANLVLVLFLSVTIGAITSWLLSLPWRSRQKRLLAEKEARIKELEQQLNQVEESHS